MGADSNLQLPVRCEPLLLPAAFSCNLGWKRNRRIINEKGSSALTDILKYSTVSGEGQANGMNPLTKITHLTQRSPINLGLVLLKRFAFKNFLSMCVFLLMFVSMIL